MAAAVRQPRAAQSTDRGDVLNHAGLVVHVHDRDERRAVAQRALDGVDCDAAERVRRDVGHRDAALLERVRGVEHGLVLDRRRDEVRASSGARKRASTQQGTLQREIVRLCRARGEEKPLCRRADARGDLGTCRVDERSRAPPGSVLRRRIAVLVLETATHRRRDGGIERRRGRVVQVDLGAHRARPRSGCAGASELNMPRKMLISF